MLWLGTENETRTELAGGVTSTCLIQLTLAEYKPMKYTSVNT